MASFKASAGDVSLHRRDHQCSVGTADHRRLFALGGFELGKSCGRVIPTDQREWRKLQLPFVTADSRKHPVSRPFVVGRFVLKPASAQICLRRIDPFNQRDLLGAVPFL